MPTLLFPGFRLVRRNKGTPDVYLDEIHGLGL